MAAKKIRAKKTIRKPARKKPAAKKIAPAKKLMKPVGRVTHFYGGIKVAVVKFGIAVKKGTPVRFEGATTKFAQKLDSMQYEHQAIAQAPKGKSVGVKVRSRVRQGDKVFLDK